MTFTVGDIVRVKDSYREEKWRGLRAKVSADPVEDSFYDDGGLIWLEPLEDRPDSYDHRAPFYWDVRELVLDSDNSPTASLVTETVTTVKAVKVEMSPLVAGMLIDILKAHIGGDATLRGDHGGPGLIELADALEDAEVERVHVHRAHLSSKRLGHSVLYLTAEDARQADAPYR